MVTTGTPIASANRVAPEMQILNESSVAGYADYLQGLDPDAVAALTREANQAGRFAGLKIGDRAAPNNNAGNWE